ncbi:MAG: hypothetical protein IJU29_05835 [Oscillospiraceae bacterium]|nr:hypothetical protein [Oscillospiraceae bacterium]
MAFTFQKNTEVRFRRDEALLRRAEENRPALRYTQFRPLGTVKLTQDPEKLGGVWTAPDSAGAALMAEGMGRGDAVILDFGAPLVGRFSVGIDSVGSPMDAPLTLRLRFAELPFELSMDNSSYDGWLSSSWFQEETVHLDTLPARLELPRRYSFRYVELRVLDTSPKYRAVFSEPVGLAQTSADRSNLTDRSCGDARLDAICRAAEKTLENCMQEVFEDGPKRDRRLWLGDLRLQALANYASFDQRELVRRCLYLFAALPTEDGRITATVFTAGEVIPDDTFLLDYSLFFGVALHDYLTRHWEERTFAELYPAAKMQTDTALQWLDGDGCFHAERAYQPFLDWGRDYDIRCAMQGVLVFALRRFLWLAEKAADPKLPEYRERLNAAAAYARNALFDAETGLFVSGPARETNLAAQVWMALAEVLPPEQSHALMEAAAARFAPYREARTPYMMHHVVQALYETGHPDKARQLIRDYWGTMLDMGADTFWEAFDPDRPEFSPYGSPALSSFCHAWSCTPIWLIKTYEK